MPNHLAVGEGWLVALSVDSPEVCGHDLRMGETNSVLVPRTWSHTHRLSSLFVISLQVVLHTQVIAIGLESRATARRRERFNFRMGAFYGEAPLNCFKNLVNLNK